jgi:hypothetical protein
LYDGRRVGEKMDVRETLKEGIEGNEKFWIKRGIRKLNRE